MYLVILVIRTLVGILRIYVLEDQQLYLTLSAMLNGFVLLLQTTIGFGDRTIDEECPESIFLFIMQVQFAYWMLLSYI